MPKVSDAYGDKVTVGESGGWVRIGRTHYGTGTSLAAFYTPEQAKALRKAIRKAEKKAKR